MRIKPLKKNESGQAVLEYVLLLVIIAFAMGVTASAISKTGISQKMSRHLKDSFARTYRYGHPLAKGFAEDAPYNEGGPVMHPRVVGGQNFRIFILGGD